MTDYFKCKPGCVTQGPHRVPIDCYVRDTRNTAEIAATQAEPLVKAFVDPAVQKLLLAKAGEQREGQPTTCDKCLLPVPRTGIFSISPYMCPRCDRTFLLDFEPMTCPNCGLKFGDESNGLDGELGSPTQELFGVWWRENRGKFQELGESGAFIIWESAITEDRRKQREGQPPQCPVCKSYSLSCIHGHVWVVPSPQPTQSFREILDSVGIYDPKAETMEYDGREFKPIK